MERDSNAAQRAWTSEQLSDAFHAGTALIGGERFLWGTREPPTSTVMLALQMVGESKNVVASLNPWIALCGGALSSPSVDGTLFHFCRRVREALGVDEPAWKRWSWYSLAGPCAAGSEGASVIDAFIVAEIHARSGGDFWGLVRAEHGVQLPTVNAESADACKAALHDALVSHHLRGLRAALGGAA